MRVAVEEVVRFALKRNYDELSRLIQQDLYDMNHLFETWCHSSHGTQRHTLLSFMGELHDDHGMKNVDACLFVAQLIDAGASVTVTATASALYYCPKCLEAVLRAGADIDGHMDLNVGSHSAPAVCSGLYRSYTAEQAAFFVEHGATLTADGVETLITRAMRGKNIELAFYFGFVLPARHHHCHEAIVVFLMIARFRFASFLDRYVAQKIVRYVRETRHFPVWDDMEFF